MGQGQASWGMSLEPVYENNRDKLDDVRPGAEAPMEVTLEGKYSFAASNALTDADEPYTPLEIVTGMNFASGNTSAYLLSGTREDWLSKYSCVPYCCELEIHNCPLFECPASTVSGEAYLFRYLRIPSPNCNLSGGTMSMSGKCHVIRPIVRRVTAQEFRDLYQLEGTEQPTERKVKPFEDWEYDSRSSLAD
jgi:hypothetical protein